MNIGFDIDGVLTDFEEYQLKYGKEFFKSEPVNKNGADIKEMFNCSNEQFEEFWRKYLIDYSTKCPMRVGSSDLIRHLQNENNNVYIITSRVYATGNDLKAKLMRKFVYNWLKNNGVSIKRDNIIFCDDSKVDAIKKYNIDLMFEDTVKNIKELKEYTNVACVRSSYNESINEDENIFVIDDMKKGYECYLKTYFNKQLNIHMGPWSGKLSIDMPWNLLQNKLREARVRDVKETDMSMYEYLYQNNKDYLDSVALHYYGNKITFREFFNKIDFAAQAFINMGVKDGDIVPVIMPNTPEALYAIYALNKIGAIPNLIHPKSSEKEIELYLEELYDNKEGYNFPGVVVCISNYLYKLDSIKNNSDIKNIISVSPTLSMPKMKKMVLSKALSAKSIVDSSVSVVEVDNSKYIISNKGDILVPRLGKLITSKLINIKRDDYFNILNYFNNDIKKLISKRYIETKNGFIHISKIDKTIKWEDFTDVKLSNEIPSLYHPNQLSILMHTGGTSGKYSKSVKLSNENFNHVAIQSEDAIYEFNRGDLTEGVVPIFHGFGLGSNVHAQLGAGMSVDLIPSPNLKTIQSTIFKNKSNHIIGIPVMLSSVIKKKLSLKKKHCHIKTVSAGGDSTKENLEDKTNEWLQANNSKARLKKGYGLTETVTAAAYSFDFLNKSGAIGLPMLGNRIKIIDKITKEELPPYSVGEICISGPTVMLGYFDNVEETNNVLKKDEYGRTWLHTGDAGYMDEFGYLYFSQRIKDVVVSSGYNIYPKQVEEAIETIDEVENCIAIGIPHVHKNEVIKCYIVLKDENQNIESIKNKINSVCKKYLPAYAYPYEYEFVTEEKVPKTKFGKINRLKLSELNKEGIKLSTNENMVIKKSDMIEQPKRKVLHFN